MSRTAPLTRSTRSSPVRRSVGVGPRPAWIAWGAIVTGLGFVGLGYTQFRKQIVEADRILALAADANRLEENVTILARRGVFYDAGGKPLATPSETYEFSVEFLNREGRQRIPNSPAFWVAMSEASGVPVAEFLQAMEIARATEGRRYSRTWSNRLSADRAERIRKVAWDWRADGVSLRRSAVRNYPLGASIAGVIGDVVNEQPLGGLELALNPYLMGVNGKKTGYRDRAGAFIPGGVVAEEPKQDGRDITLTIRADLQEAVSQAVRRGVELREAERGSAIVLDPRTGDVLAMASWPTFDPTGAVKFEPDKVTDAQPAFQHVFDPGSTFKPLTLALALDAGQARPSDAFACNGSLMVGSRPVRCSPGAHGTINPEAAIAKSCNGNAAIWAMRSGRPAFIRMLDRLGLTTTTGIGFPGEVRSRVLVDEWDQTRQLATWGFGQSMSMTPMALASAFSCLANDGVRMQPRLVKRIGDREVPERAADRVFSVESARMVLGMMESVIESDIGTGRSLRIPNYRMAGKTGTAQIIQQGMVEGYVANFVGFLPAHNPRVTILVMIERPRTPEYSGGAVAGPVFREIAEACIRSLGIPPNRSITVSSVALGDEN